MADEQADLVAAHPPAVKAGGMRIVQHKTPTAERPANGAEDCTELTETAGGNSLSISGAPMKGNIVHTPQAVQVAHALKPPARTIAKTNTAEAITITKRPQ